MEYGDKFRNKMINIIQTNLLINRLIAFGKQSLVTNAGYLMGISLVNSIVGFLFWGLATRLYRPEDIGFTSAFISAAFLVCGLTDFGLSMGLVRYLPEARTPIKFLNTIFSFEVLTSVLAGVAYLAGVSIWTPSLSILQGNRIYFVGFLFYITFYTLGSIVNRSFIARRKSLYALFFNCVSNGSRLLLIIFLVGFGIAGLFASLTFSLFLAASMSLFYLLPKIQPGYRLHPDFDRSVLATILPYSLGNFIVGILSMVLQRLLPLLIIEMLGPASNGHFYIAWMIGDLLYSPSSALSDSLFAEGSNSPKSLKPHLVRSVVIGLGLTVPAAIIVGLGSPYILMLFGPTYAQEASGLLRCLAIAAPMCIINSLYFTNLRVKKEIKLLILVSAILVVVTLGITFYLIPRFGITAVGIGWLIGHSLTLLESMIGLGWFKNIISYFLNNNRRKDIHPLGKSREI
jgi:O-antigen/teichoic acid export membrane protein